MGKADIIVVGCGSAGRTVTSRLEEINSSLSVVVDSQFTEPKEVFEIIKRPELPDIWIDPNEPIFNQHKHNQTCAKNRKKRKKRKRR